MSQMLAIIHAVSRSTKLRQRPEFLWLLLLSYAGQSAALVTVKCEPGEGGLEVSWNGVAETNWYDLQLGIPGVDQPLAGHHTNSNRTTLTVKNLVPLQTYWFELMAFFDAAEGESNWHAVSERKECVAPGSLRSTPTTPRRRGFFDVDILRHHNSFDGLSEHNGGDVASQARMFSTGFHMASCKLGLYHVHVKKTDIPGQVTPCGPNSQHYANYLSCNADWAGKYHCRPINDADCRLLVGPCGSSSPNGKQCAKARDDQYSKNHVGMARRKVPGVDHDEGPRWYSLPEAGNKAGNWHVEDQHLKADCYKGMTEDDIKKAFHLHFMYLQLWRSDIPAFPSEAEEASVSSLVV